MFRLMEKARNRNNKGFSLVELIVVVLIIAIIAVALAPQVVKYVQKSRNSVELNNEATIKSAVQSAVAEYESQIAAPALENCSFYIDGTESKITSMTDGKNEKPANGDSSARSLQAIIQENLGKDKLDQNYGVTIDINAKVEVSAIGSQATAPDVPKTK